MTLQNKAQSADPLERPRFRVIADPRCCAPIADRRSEACNMAATRHRLTPGAQHALFFCDRCAAPTDPKIPPAFDVQRITITLDVVFTGTNLNRLVSEHQALDRLARAVEAAGGLVNLHAVRSDIGRYERPAATERGPRPRGAR